MSSTRNILYLKRRKQCPLIIHEHKFIVRNDINKVGADVECRLEEVGDGHALAFGGGAAFAVGIGVVLIFHDMRKNNIIYNGIDGN